jgi:PAS domain S-box-containing protein
MADSIDQIFWMLDVNANRILYTSPAFERVWGRSPENIEERSSLLDMVHPDDLVRVDEYFRKSIGKPCKETYRIVRPDGAVRWILDRAFPVFNQDNELYRITGTWEDITDRRALEEQLGQIQKMAMRSVLDAAFCKARTSAVDPAHIHDDTAEGLMVT